MEQVIAALERNGQKYHHITVSRAADIPIIITIAKDYYDHKSIIAIGAMIASEADYRLKVTYEKVIHALYEIMLYDEIAISHFISFNSSIDEALNNTKNAAIELIHSHFSLMNLEEKIEGNITDQNIKKYKH